MSGWLKFCKKMAGESLKSCRGMYNSVLVLFAWKWGLDFKSGVPHMHHEFCMAKIYLIEAWGQFQ